MNVWICIYRYFKSSNNVVYQKELLKMDVYFENQWIGNAGLQSASRIDFYTSHKVNDEVRGYLIYDNGNWKLVKPSIIGTSDIIEKIALILESPHKDEYVSNSNPPNPVRPANGNKYGTAGYAINHFIVNRNWINNL